MTTTANVGTIIVPIGMSTRSGPYKYGSGLVYKISDLKKKKRKKNKYSDIGIAYIDTTNGMNESLSGEGSVDLTKFNGEIGVWRTIKGRHYFFALNKSGPTPPFPFKKDTGKSGGSKKEKAETKSKSGSGKSKGDATGKGSNSKSGEPKKDSKKKDNIPNREDILDKVEEMILKASRSKGGKVVLGPLKQMQAALRADDPDAFRKAEMAVSKATKKLAKRKGR